MLKSNSLEKNEYQCAYCNKIFTKGLSDKEAEEEAQKLWGNIPLEERIIICDDCFNLVNPEARKIISEEYKSIKNNT